MCVCVRVSGRENRRTEGEGRTREKEKRGEKEREGETRRVGEWKRVDAGGGRNIKKDTIVQVYSSKYT